MVLQQSLIKEKGILRLNGISADNILALLENKHIKDVFVSECKNGETWGRRDLLKLDAWVLCRTYSPLTMIGYEIKTSRQDFEQDQKWTGYLDLCHQFYFVCPAGLIRAEDLPNRIGIIWASKDKLHTKRKAERVNPDIEKVNRLLVYVLMSRIKIVANMFEIDKEEPKDKITLRREELERAEARSELALFVRGHIRRIHDEINKKEADIASRERVVKDFESHLARLGIIWDSEKSTWQDNMAVNQQIDKLKSVIDNWIECIGGCGLAGNGCCSERGEWNNPKCPKFYRVPDYMRG